MREYETFFVLRPQVSEGETRELTDRLAKLVSQHKGEVLLNRFLGKRQIAYRMSKEKDGIYIQLDYSGGGSLVSEMEHLLRLDERVVRFLTVVLQDDVNIEQRKKQLEEQAAAAAVAATVATT